MEFREKIKHEFEKLSTELSQERDALKVRAHLFKMEAKEEWDELEKKYQHFKSAKMPGIRQATEESTDQMKEKLEQASHEIKKGYQHIKESLKNRKN